MARLDGQIASLVVPQGLVSRADEIEAVYKERGVYCKAQADLPGLIARREHLEKEAAALLHELRPEMTLADADELRLSRRQQIEIQNLGNRKEALEKQLAQARSEITDSRQRLVEVSAQLAQLPPPRDPAPLAEALRAARSQGSLSQQSVALRAEIAALTGQAAIDLHKLGLWSGSLEDLEKLALPAAETVRSFRGQPLRCEGGICPRAGAVEKARADAAEIECGLERLRLEGEVPSEAELVEARNLRDAGWRLVRQDWRSGGIDSTALQPFLAAMGESTDLAVAFEQSVRRTDELSDRLRREAIRVANRATLQAQQLALQQQTAELRCQQVCVQEQLQQIEAEWRQVWQPTGIDPLPPREMQAWIQQQQGLIQQAQRIRQRTASLTDLDNQIAAHCRQLQSCLDALLAGSSPGLVPQAFQPDLDSFLARGDIVLEQIKQAAEARQQCEREKNRLAKAATQAEARTAQAEADLADWRARWTAAIQPLGLPADSSPLAVNEVVTQTMELLAKRNEIIGFAERIDGIGRDSQRFREAVQQVLKCVDPDGPPPGDRLEESLEELSIRLRRAVTDQKNLGLLQSQRKKEEESDNRPMRRSRRTVPGWWCSAKRHVAGLPRSFPPSKPPRSNFSACGTNGKRARINCCSLPREQRSMP